MPDLTGRVRKHGSDDLQSDETILKSLVGQPPGSKARKLKMTGLGPSAIRLKGLAHIGADQVLALNKQIENAVANRIPKQGVYITLTDVRMLVHTTTKLGNPKKLVASYSFEEISGVRVDNPNIGDGEVFVQYFDDSVTNLLMVTSQEPEEFVDAWNQVRLT